MSEASDLEAPVADVIEQSLPVADVSDVPPPVERLTDDLEAPESDVLEQRQPAVVDDDDWR